MNDEFSMYDAAYLLGALTPPDRAAFETHLVGCQDCRQAVNQLAGMPGLLANVAPEHKIMANDDGPAVPDTLLPRLLAEVQRTRFRRRWTTGLVGVAAAAVIAIALVFGLTGSHSGVSNQPPTQLAAERMTPVSPNLPIHARVLLADKPWGTELTIWCTYAGEGEHPGGTAFTYTMVVTDKSGASQQIAAWVAKPGQPVMLDGASSVPQSEIASVQVRGPSDVPLLLLKP